MGLIGTGFGYTGISSLCARNDIYIDKYCTGFIILRGMVCITILSTIMSLNIFNFSYVFKISLVFVEMYLKSS